MILDIVDDLIRIPYKRNGDTPEDGFDCYTFTVWARKTLFGKETPTVFEAASTDVKPDILIPIFDKYIKASDNYIEVLEPKDGDIVLLGNRVEKRFHHCGIWVDGYVVHCMRKLNDGGGVCAHTLKMTRRMFTHIRFYREI